MGGTRGFSVRYPSCTALDRDHAAYLIHGGLVVPYEDDPLPAPNTRLMIRIESPGGPSFELVARVGQAIPGRGFMASFEAESRAAQGALDRFVQGSEFQATVQKEADQSVAPPTVVPLPLEPITPPPPPNQASANPAPPPTEDLTLDDSPLAPADRTEVPTSALHPDVDAVQTASAPTSTPPSPGTTTTTTTLRKPQPGETYWVFVLKFTTLMDYVEHARDFITTQRIRVPNRQDHDVKANDPARLRLTLPGHNQFEMWGVVEMVVGPDLWIRVSENDEQFRKAVLHPETVTGKKRLERELPEHRRDVVVVQLQQDVPLEDIEKMPIRRRLQRMGMDDKVNLALSGNREERMALATDGNRAVHHYLLKNAKITMDEIAFMSRLPSLNPDVLDKIAENPAYVQNPTVVKALVYNPKTPVKTAIRLLDRLPRPEVLNLSKRMTMNRRLVMAAKKKIERKG